MKFLSRFSFLNPGSTQKSAQALGPLVLLSVSIFIIVGVLQQTPRNQGGFSRATGTAEPTPTLAPIVTEFTIEREDKSSTKEVYMVVYFNDSSGAKVGGKTFTCFTDDTSTTSDPVCRLHLISTGETCPSDTKVDKYACDMPDNTILSSLFSPAAATPDEVIKVCPRGDHGNLLGFSTCQSAAEATTSKQITVNPCVEKGGTSFYGIYNVNTAEFNDITLTYSDDGGVLPVRGGPDTEIHIKIAGSGTYYGNVVNDLPNYQCDDSDVKLTIESTSGTQTGSTLTGTSAGGIPFIVDQVHSVVDLEYTCLPEKEAVVTGNKYQQDLDADGNYLVYVESDADGNQARLKLLNLITGATTQIFSTAGQAFDGIWNPDIEGNWISFSHKGPGSSGANDSRFKLFNISNNQITSVDTSTSSPYEIAGHVNQNGKYLYYKNTSSGGDRLFVQEYGNIATGLDFNMDLVNDPLAISNNYAYWSQNNDIMQFNLNGSAPPANLSNLRASNIAVEGDLMVFSVTNGGIWVYDRSLGTYNKIRTTVGRVSQIRINDGMIVWGERTSQSNCPLIGCDYYVYAYPYPNGQVFQITRSNDPATDVRPAVSGRRIFWNDLAGINNQDIFSCELKFHPLIRGQGQRLDTLPTPTPSGPTPTNTPTPTPTLIPTPNVQCVPLGEICGGFMNAQCCAGGTCKIDSGTAGTCVESQTRN